MPSNLEKFTEVDCDHVKYCDKENINNRCRNNYLCCPHYHELNDKLRNMYTENKNEFRRRID